MYSYWFSDPFLPRIVELATKSGDRQTKVAACELLHSLILLCVGRSATQPARERYSMAPLYKKMFPSILQLACDVDLVGILACLKVDVHLLLFSDPQ